MLRTLRELRRYPSAILGLFIIGFLIGLAIYTVIAIPYSRAIDLWRAGPGVWDENPRNAWPAWLDFFTPKKLPRTIIADLRKAEVQEQRSGDQKKVELVLPVEFTYDDFPSEITLYLQVVGTAPGTRVRYSAEWENPLGQRVELAVNRSIRGSDSYFISQSPNIMAALGAAGEYALFSDVNLRLSAAQRTVLQGTYRLYLQAELPQEAKLEGRLIVYGRIHGLAGTDHLRRDLTVALMWGAPVALAFGLLAAFGSVLSTFVLAGIGTWFGGWVDGLFQRLTEINMIIPMLPILIMIGQFYSRSLWLMLGVVIALSIFSGAMKTYRAMFLQAKEAPYIEAARAYGASDFRLIFRYLLPKMVPVILPSLIMLIPGYVFLEAALSVIGLGDPLLPTWGKIISDARTADALYKGHYYWVIEPALLLMLTGFGFAMVGYALDRVFNPRLRTL
ncbi:MAG: ABC transporter permease [Candidatus Bipolaricaulaceae bacterium]